MEDEIKEILQKIKNVANRETASRNALMEMQDKDYQLLLDYITNLQESEAYYYGQYKDYKSRFENAIEYLEYQISQLDFEKDTKAKMLGAMVLVLLKGSDKE